MIKNKTLLLICKETSSFPIYFLGKELEKNNKVHYFFIHNNEVLNKDHFNKDSFFYFKKKINNKYIHDVNDLNLKFLKNRKKILIDFSRLNEIEKKYTYFTGLNKQLLSSQTTSTPYHDRYYYPPTSYEENLYWLTLNYDKIEQLLEMIKPDYIFDLQDTGEIQRTIINEIAHYKNIPYIGQEDARYKSFNLPTFSIGRHLDEYFIHAYNKTRDKNEMYLEKYISEIKNYRSQANIMPKKYKDDSTSSYNFSFLELLEYIIKKIFKFLKIQFASFKNDKYKVPINTPLFNNLYKRYLWTIFYAIKKFYLYSKFNKYFQIPNDEKYIYMPLHLIPESSTYIKAPMYLNEISLIEAVSKSLPISWKLYVKEHQSMIGQRNMEFYKKIKKFHNVKIVKSNFYKDPKPWIEKSLGIVTITGTTAFEASMLNKPAIVFGSVFYNTIPSIKFAKSFEELEQLFRLIENNNWPQDNTLDCAAYLKTVNELGVDLDIEYLIKLSLKKIKSKQLDINEENNLKDMIDKLISFYEKAININNK
jgi:hypothetical protein